MENNIVIFAPAKLNLYLKVIRKIENGYHEIITLFEKIALFDKISIRIDNKIKKTKICCDNLNVPVCDNSLMQKAINLYCRKSKINERFSIQIKKKIPIAAGLGGASSDVAAILKGINSLNNNILNKEELIDIASTLGSDISFFIENSSFAYGFNRGERIKQINTKLRLWHVLVKPKIQIFTKDVYNKVSDFDLTKYEDIDKLFSSFLEEEDTNSITKYMFNSLQKIVLNMFPELNIIFDVLKDFGAKKVLLSGSGSTVFGIFDKEKIEEKIQDFKKFFKKDKYKIFIVETC